VREKDGTLRTQKKWYLEEVRAGRGLAGKVLHRDPARDLALVQLDKVPADTPALTLARNGLKADDPFSVIFNPPAVDYVFAALSAKTRAVGRQEVDIGKGDRAIRLRARTVDYFGPVGCGTGSGAPLLDRRGSVVGVSTSIYFGPVSPDRAIDVTEVRAFLTENKVELPEPKTDPAPKK
jgi:S1-C subfamily serine protease